MPFPNFSKWKTFSFFYFCKNISDRLKFRGSGKSGKSRLVFLSRCYWWPFAFNQCVKSTLELYTDEHCCCTLQDVVCKSLTALRQYLAVANTAWMFVEGLYLHQRVAVSVFNTTHRFYLYHAIGWGLFVKTDICRFSKCFHYYFVGNLQKTTSPVIIFCRFKSIAVLSCTIRIIVIKIVSE